MSRKALLRRRLLSLRETFVLAGTVEKEKEIRNDIPVVCCLQTA